MLCLLSVGLVPTAPRSRTLCALHCTSADVKSFLPSHDQLRTTRLAAAEMNGRYDANSSWRVLRKQVVTGS